MQWFRRITDDVERRDFAGWMLMLSGLVMAGIVVLTPAAVQVSQLGAELQVMNQQLDRIQRQAKAYNEFTIALEQGDPLILQRLAWGDLHLKPVGARILSIPSANEPASTARFESTHADFRPITTPAAQPVLPDTRLIRWTSGSHRLWFAAAAVALMAWGLLRGLKSRPA